MQQQPLSFGAIQDIGTESAPICITSGRANYDAYKAAKFQRVLFLPYGAQTMHLEQMLSEAWPKLENRECVYLDVAGKIGDEISHRLSSLPVARIRWSNQAKGASDVLSSLTESGNAKLGIEMIRAAVRAAKPVPVEGVYEPDQFLDSLMDLYDKGLPPGYSLGFNGLTTEQGKEIYTIATPSLNIFTGYYGSGKSEFIENIEIIMAQNELWKWAIFNPETQPPSLALANLVEKLTGMPFGKEIHFDEYGKPRKRLDKETLIVAHKFIQEHFRFMLPQEKNFTIDNIIEMSSSLIKSFGINAIVIDPFNMVEYNKPVGMREDIYIAQCLLKLNAFKRKHNMWIGVAAHPKTPQPNTKGEYPVPSIMALAGGMMFGNMIDMGVSVHRNKLEPSEPVQIHIQKCKFKHWGRLEVGLLDFDLATSRYKDAKDQYGNTIFAGFDLRKLKQK